VGRLISGACARTRSSRSRNPPQAEPVHGPLRCSNVGLARGYNGACRAPTAGGGGLRRSAVISVPGRGGNGPKKRTPIFTSSAGAVASIVARCASKARLGSGWPNPAPFVHAATCSGFERLPPIGARGRAKSTVAISCGAFPRLSHRSRARNAAGGCERMALLPQGIACSEGSRSGPLGASNASSTPVRRACCLVMPPALRFGAPATG